MAPAWPTGGERRLRYRGCSRSMAREYECDSERIGPLPMGTVWEAALTGSNGGGILNNGSTLTLSGCTVSGNSVGSGLGGGIYNSNNTSTLTVSGCKLSGNIAYDGGGVYNSIGATATIVNSTLSGNISTGGDYDEGDGGGVYNFEGTVTLSGCTLSGNSAGLDGGAVYTYGYVEIEKHKNVIVIGKMTISDCAVTGNSAFDGAGFYNASTTSNAETAMISNSVFSANGPFRMGLAGARSPAVAATLSRDAETQLRAQESGQPARGFAEGENPNRPGRARRSACAPGLTSFSCIADHFPKGAASCPSLPGCATGPRAERVTAGPTPSPWSAIPISRRPAPR